MTIQVRAVSTPTADTGDATINQTKPTGTLTGDFVLASFSLTSEAVSLPHPTIDGWYEVPRGSINGEDNICSFYRIAIVGEPASYDFTCNANVTGSMGIISFYSDTAQPITIDDSNFQYNASSTNRVFPSLTASAAGMLICLATLTSSVTSTPPGGMTERWDVTISGNKTWSGTEPIAASGATGTRTATGTASISKCVSIMLIEAALEHICPRYIASTLVATATQTVTQVNGIPSEAEVDDFALFHVSLTETLGLVAPSGWVVEYLNDAAGGMGVYSKTLTQADIDAGSVAVTWSSNSTAISSAVSIYRSPNGLLLAVEASAPQTNASAASMLTPSVTFTSDTGILVVLGSKANNIGISADSQIDIWERYDFGSSSPRCILLTDLQVTAGATGTRTIAWTTGSHASVVLVLAIVEIPEDFPDARMFQSEGYYALTYRSVDLTEFLKGGTLEAIVEQLESMSLADSRPQSQPGKRSWNIQLEGLLTKELDDLLGIVSLEPPEGTSMDDVTVRLGAIDNGTLFTWEGGDGVGGTIADYKIGPNTQFMGIPFTARILTSGQPTREALI